MILRVYKLIITIFFVLILSGCNDNKVLENLTQEQANQVLSILQQHNISASKSGTLKAGYTVYISQSDNTAALSIINQYQLPWSSDVQIGNAFPDNSLVSSPNAEQTRIQSLQEQRLEQSLRIIPQVVNARVHMGYPSLITDTGGNKPTKHVGILISYKGSLDENLFINQIKSLIKNSIDNIRYENISVVLFHAPEIQLSEPNEINNNSLFNEFNIVIFSIIIIAMLYLFYILRKKHNRMKIINTDSDRMETHENSE